MVGGMRGGLHARDRVAGRLKSLALALTALVVGWGLLGSEIAEAAHAQGGLTPTAHGLLGLDAVAGHVALLALWHSRRQVRHSDVALAVLLTTVSAFAVAPVLIWLGVLRAPARRVRSMAGAAVAAGMAAHELVVRSWVSGASTTLGSVVGVALASLMAAGAAVAVGSFVASRQAQLQAHRRQAAQAVRDQEAAVARAHLAERNRIAREMHDSLAHRLSVVALHAGAMAARPDLPRETQAETSRVVHDTVHEALEELRSTLGSLRASDPALGVRAPGLSDLPMLIAEAGRHGEVTVSDRHAILTPHGPVAPAVGGQLYRIIQEALTNARKHATRAPVDVSLRAAGDGELVLEVTNPLSRAPGRSEASGPGYGLIGMAERAELVGGRLSAGPEAGRFVVRAMLPMTERDGREHDRGTG
ncbi:histidine kinase [Intrasporangium sp. DVR]|uniref:sensor histidine kinase n=1 Tax=Intrasporangium sp. DVR TaxID=3127867 RepID=UPI00313A5450